jgi:predicted ATP-grasp superfamily ATP-dependent carboligase
VHAINPGKGLEWKLAEIILDLAKQLSAKEIICLEGVGSPNSKERVFFHGRNMSKRSTKILESCCEPLKEGVIVGVTGAILAKRSKIAILSLFAEAQGNGPDSNAAAGIIKSLDKYVGFNLDPAPLHEQAKIFEGKLKDVVKKHDKARKIQDKKSVLSYVG